MGDPLDKDWGSGERLEATYVERVFLEMVYYRESRKSRARSSKSIYIQVNNHLEPFTDHGTYRPSTTYPGLLR